MTLLKHRCSKSADDIDPSPTDRSVLHSSSTVAKFVAIAAIGCGLALFLTYTEIGLAFRSAVMRSWLGQSGFIPALSLIFMSEIGDKTFFICALLAMRLGRWIAFLGTILALGLTTVISVGAGVAFRAIPDAMKTSLPIGKYLSVALFLIFGVRNIISSVKKEEDGDDGFELADAQEMVQRAQETGQVADAAPEDPHITLNTWRRRFRYIFVVAALVFVAEWGDRSMLTTIALGASQNPIGVALGGICGHSIATAIAVVGGAVISNFISERRVNFVSGSLFILFAITTAFNWT